MAYLLWQLLRDAYSELGQLQVSAATGGTTTTIVDSKLIGAGRDDDWNGGAVIVLSAGGAAPEGEFGRVSDYVDAAGTLTVPEMSAAVESGDLYGLVSEYYPLQQMIELANQALRNLGDLTHADTTTLDTAAGQTEYPAAIAWKRRPPRRIDIQTRTGDADDHRWALVRAWDYVPAAAGESGVIVFRSPLRAGRELRIWYEDAHPRVSAYDDEIREEIHPALAVAAAVEKALVWQVSRLDGWRKRLPAPAAGRCPGRVGAAEAAASSLAGGAGQPGIGDAGEGWFGVSVRRPVDEFVGEGFQPSRKSISGSIIASRASHGDSCKPVIDKVLSMKWMMLLDGLESVIRRGLRRPLHLPPGIISPGPLK